jgi:iron complex outermembrane receptor protein
MTRSLPIALLVLCTGAAALAGQQSDSLHALPPLQVTVTRTPVPDSAAGASITVIDSAALHRGHIATGLDETLAFTPGVIAQNRYNFSVDERISIRGFGARANFGLRGIKVLLDGVPQTLPDGQSQLTNIDLSLVQRIEVLRGASSSLYGNATGGVISLTSATAPTESYAVTARGEAGSFGTTKEQAVLAGRAGALSGTLALSRFATDGLRQQSADAQRQLSVGADWALGASTVLTARFWSANDPRAQNPGALTAPELAANADSAAATNIRRGADKRVTQNQLALGLHHDARHWHLDATLYGLVRSLENPLATPPPAPASFSEGTFVGIDRVVGGLRSTLSADLAAVTLSGGVDQQNLRDNRRNWRSVGGIATDTLLIDQREQVAETGIFLAATAPVGHHLTLRAGARRDIDRFRVADHLLTDGDASATRNLPSSSGNAGVLWQVAPHLSAWTNVATIFETPTTTELANRPDGAGGFNPDLNPERSLTTELGARGGTGKLVVEAAAYWTRTRDAIVPYSEVAGRSYFRNAGDTRTTGIEATATLRIMRGLAAQATWTHTHATFTDYQLVTPSSSDNLDGHRLAGIPGDVARVGVHGELGAGFTLDVDQALSSMMYADDDNTIAVAGWGAGVTAIRAQWTRATLRGVLMPFLGITNLFDRRYVGSVTTNGIAGRVFEPAAPRGLYIGLSVTARAPATSGSPDRDRR